jgi:hypothetical protein
VRRPDAGSPCGRDQAFDAVDAKTDEIVQGNALLLQQGAGDLHSLPRHLLGIASADQQAEIRQPVIKPETETGSPLLQPWKRGAASFGRARTCVDDERNLVSTLSEPVQNPQYLLPRMGRLGRIGAHPAPRRPGDATRCLSGARVRLAAAGKS